MDGWLDTQINKFIFGFASEGILFKEQVVEESKRDGCLIGLVNRVAWSWKSFLFDV